MKNRLKSFWQGVWATLMKPEMAILPGQLAFFIILSIVPAITVFSYYASFFHLPVDFLYNFIAKAFNADLARMIVTGVTGSKLGLKFFITIIVALYFASNGAASVIVTSNTIYGIKNDPWILRRLKALVMTFLIMILVVFILIVPIFGNYVNELITYVNLNPTITDKLVALINMLRGPLYWLIIFVIVKLLYVMSPDKKVKSTHTTYGALFTSVCWILITELYSYYVNNFAVYDIFYGSLANIIILMLWIFFLSYIFTVGMALNYDKQHKLEKTGEINIK